MTVSVQNGLSAEVLPASALRGEPKDIAAILAPYRPADAAEMLNSLDQSIAARVLEAMPVQAVVQIFNEPHLDEPARLIELMPVDCAPAILIGLHPDRRTDIFRQLPEEVREALTRRLPDAMRASLDELLRYPPDSAGGIMTTDFVSVPADWTVERTLQHVHAVGKNKETVYTVCLLDPETKRLVKMVGLWRLVISDPKTFVLDAARPYKPIAVSPLTDREEVARLLSKTISWPCRWWPRMGTCSASSPSTT
jgi:magnesium transporter